MEYAKRLLVADTSDEFRRHLIEALQNESDMEVVGETGDGQQLLEICLLYTSPSPRDCS